MISRKRLISYKGGGGWMHTVCGLSNAAFYALESNFSVITYQVSKNLEEDDFQSALFLGLHSLSSVIVMRPFSVLVA